MKIKFIKEKRIEIIPLDPNIENNSSPKEGLR